MERRYELVLDEGYAAVWLYRSVGQREGGPPAPDNNGSIQGLYIKKGELTDPPPKRLSILVSSE